MKRTFALGYQQAATECVLIAVTEMAASMNFFLPKVAWERKCLTCNKVGEITFCIFHIQLCCFIHVHVQALMQ